jgi:hypothetical protein
MAFMASYHVVPLIVGMRPDPSLNAAVPGAGLRPHGGPPGIQFAINFEATSYDQDRVFRLGRDGYSCSCGLQRECTGADCDIKSYALSGEQMKPLGNDVALITYKTTVYGTCGGQKVRLGSLESTRRQET